MIVGVKTHYKTIIKIADIPILGGVFLFVLIFIPAILIAFALQTTVPSLHNKFGFTKAYFVALPLWNLLLWFFRLKLYIFFVPAWLLVGGIAVYQAFSLFSGEELGKKLPYADEASVWNNLYQKTELDGQRIALEGYIYIKRLKSGSDHYCQLVDENENHLLHMFVKEKSKNSVDITPLETERTHTDDVAIDKANSFTLDNNGNKIPLDEKILLSFEIDYGKAGGGVYVPLTYKTSAFDPIFQNVAQDGDKYYDFTVKNIRIDRAE